MADPGRDASTLWGAHSLPAVCGRLACWVAAPRRNELSKTIQLLASATSSEADRKIDILSVSADGLPGCRFLLWQAGSLPAESVKMTDFHQKSLRQPDRCFVALAPQPAEDILLKTSLEFEHHFAIEVWLGRPKAWRIAIHLGGYISYSFIK